MNDEQDKPDKPEAQYTGALPKRGRSDKADG